MEKSKKCILLTSLMVIFLLISQKYVIYGNNAEADIKLDSINIGKTSYGAGYIYGHINANVRPKIIFKSTDGKIKKEVYIEKSGTNRYYFDRHLVEIDFSKEYVFEVTIGNTTKNLDLGSNRVLGKYNIYKVVSKDSKISILKDEYEGIPIVSLKTVNLGTTSYGAKYIYGTIEYTESVNGNKTDAKVAPKIVMKSIDGTVSEEVFVSKQENNIYYFDRHIFERFDMNKEYIFEVESADERNTTTKKANIVFGNRDLGLNTNKYEICTEKDKVKFILKTYVGEPIVELKELKLGKTSYGAGYIYGKITYKENINGSNKSSTDKPILIFKSADGKTEKEVYVEKIENDTYYFDRHIFNSFDMTKEYIFEVKSGDIRNTYSGEKSITLGTKNLGVNGEYKVLTKNNKVYFEKDIYNAEPSAELKSLNLGKTQTGGTYIYGNLKYTEILGGKQITTKEDPVIVFKSTDGKVEKEVYVNKIDTNIYYFDRHLDGLDISRQYIFYVKTGDKKNQNTSSVSITLESKKLGLYGKYNVTTEKNVVKLTINQERYRGIDVSSWQGQIDWKQVASDGIDFAIIRVGYRGYVSGKIVLDNMFSKNIVEARSANIDCGVYFATQAITVEEAIEEARYTINNIKSYNITGPVVIDTEDSGSNGRADNLSIELRTEIVNAFCETIKNAGYTPVIYANKWWLTDNLNMNKLGYYDVWLAHYVSGAPENLSDYKGNYTIWQYTNAGSVKGISGNVDLNIAYRKY